MRPQRSLLRFGLAAQLSAAFVAAVVASAHAQLTIGTPEVDFRGDVSIRLTTSRADKYYLLLYGETLDAIRTPVDAQLGTAGSLDLHARRIAHPDFSFFQAMEVPVANPFDTDGDGIDDVWELRHSQRLNPLDPGDAARDPDGNGFTSYQEYLQATTPLTVVSGVSPYAGEQNVSVNRETILHLSNPLATDATVGLDALRADFGGRRILSRAEIARDRRKVTLFYLEPLPGSARVRVTFKADAIRDVSGRAVDADGDGQPGGTATLDFDTQGLTPLPNTIVCGRIFASELAIPSAGNTNVSINAPLPGVTVTVDGMEEAMRAVSDQFGNFRLTNAPAGPFFVHIDGRTVTDVAHDIHWPDGNYYPYVGKRWESIAGREVNIGEVYLPLIASGTLKPVSPTHDTLLEFSADFVAQHPQFAGVKFIVPPGSLFSDTGARGGRVGIAPVPPDRLPGPLPEGLPIQDIVTIQTDGPGNFDTPVSACFPNLPDPKTGQKLPPGAKSALWSFNHDTGQFEIVGGATVSADGMLVCTDPGVGILAPGWHGTAPGAAGGGGGGDGPPPGPPPPPPPCKLTGQTNCCSSGGPGSAGGAGGAGGAGSGCGGLACSKPIQLSTGEEYLQETDLEIPAVGMHFRWTRTYGSRFAPNTAQGNNWDSGWNMRLISEGRGIRVCDGAYRSDLFRPRPDGTYGLNGFFRELKRHPDGSFTLTFEDGLRWEFLAFDGSPAAGKAVAVVDRNGNTMRLHYDSQGRLDRVADTLDREITVSYTATGYIAAVTDFAGRSVRYTYYGSGETGGSVGDLKSVTTPAVVGTPNGNDFPEGKTTTYTYTRGFADDRLNHNLLTITDGRGNTFVENVYAQVTNPDDPLFDRVVRQVWGGGTVDFTYLRETPSPENGEAAFRTIVNDRVGNVTEFFYDTGHRLVVHRAYTGRADPTLPTTETLNRPSGRLRPSDPEFFETRTEYNADNRPTRVTHPNGNLTEYVYESDLDPTAPIRTRGNLRVVRYLPGSHLPAGDQDAIAEYYEYGEDFGCPSCGFNFVTKFTDGRGNVILSQYDDRGNLIARTNQIPSIVERFAYDQLGRMTNHIHPDNGNGHHREDWYTYYDAGPMKGYLHEEIVDANHFHLTTTHEYDAVGNVVRRTDPRGHATQFVVNALNQVVREISPEILDGSGVRYREDFFFDENNNLVMTETDNRLDLLENHGEVVAGNPTWTVRYAYGLLNELTNKVEEVEPDRFVSTEYQYDLNRNLTLTRFGEAMSGRQPNNAVRVVYDERNLPFLEIRGPGDPAQSTTQFDYDPNGNRIRTWHGLEDSPHLTVFTYDGYDRQVVGLDPMGNVTTNNYDPSGNRIATWVYGELEDVPGSAANVRLSETWFGFDALNRMTNRAVAFFNATNQVPIGDGWATTRTLYTDTSQILAIINDNHHGTTNSYDTAQRLRAVTDAKGNTVTYDYDGNGNPVEMTEVELNDLQEGPGVSPVGPVETFHTYFGYDAKNRLVATTDNVGNVTRSGFDPRDNRIVGIDARTNTVRYAHDGLSRLTATTRVMTESGHGAPPVVLLAPIVTRQVWDDTSRLVQQIDDNGNATTYLHDALSRKFATVYADGTGQTNWLDAHGNAPVFTDANGNWVTNRFDANDRLVRRDVAVGPGVSDDTTFEVYKYDGLGRLTWAQDDDSLVTRAYDSLGHVRREVQGLAGCDPAVVEVAYDGEGNETELHYPSGRLVTTTYDELERKKRIADANGTIALYHFVGPRRVARRDNGNGTISAYSYNGMSGLPKLADDHGVRKMIRSAHTRTNDKVEIDDRAYRWDEAGNKTQNKDLSVGGTRLSHDYRYDSVGRLTRSVKSQPGGPSETITYEFDGVGNRLAMTGGADAGKYGLDGALPEPADRQMNQYSSTPSNARQYDRNGNLDSIDPAGALPRAFAYDYLNRGVAFVNEATSVATAYAYDALGRRGRKSLTGGAPRVVRLIYRGWQEIEEQAGNTEGGAKHTFGLDLDELVASDIGKERRYYLVDCMFSVVEILKEAGEISMRIEYGDFGQPSYEDVNGNPVPGLDEALPRLFGGRIYDLEEQLYCFRTRYLDPNIGQFITRDARGAWFDKRCFGNGRTYAANNPATYRDPYGEASARCAKWLNDHSAEDQYTQRCAAGTQAGLSACCGVNVRGGDAYGWGGNLMDAGFVEVDMDAASLDCDVRTAVRSDGTRSGHAEFYFGGHWYSDTKQRNSQTPRNRYKDPKTWRRK